ncbi:MAG: SoxR reducing system RseC family protein [Gammaproteobacteria bacterium]|nr:SoxR reducing system RseC family protein [Gammaproteobacteria bacterium]MBQ0839775.1 SoxR reducing system RseC family protein [Gammaproteobacteria bacterium]
MIEESVQVLRVESDYLWVEGVQRSACHSCSAQQGCGQRLLARLSAHPVRLRIALDGRDARSFQVGQDVTIGIADHVVVRGSLLIYFLPLLMLLFGIWLGDRFFGSEFAAILCGALALFAGGFVAASVVNAAANRSTLQARLLDV